MLLPFVGLLLVEGGLRLAGYGESYPLFIPERRADGWVHVNPRVVRRFMVDERDTPNLWIRPVSFRPEKSPETFRIFVQGGSSAEGYPYGYGASPAGMLQQRLQRTFPERRVEVVTTAMSAVNTYTLLDFSREILEQHPDLIVIYAGHNEYLGLLGVGSTFSAGHRRPLVLTFLALENVRLLQLGRRALAALRPRPATRDRHSLMQRVVAEDRILYGSELYRRGLEQYRANLTALLRRYREAGVPVFLGTVVSNERDRKPFISGPGPGADVAAWKRHFDAASEAFTSGDAASALAELDAAVAIDDLHAAGHFARGRVLESLGRYGEAREAYLAAKDRDELRFRAPEAINEILRQVAAEQGAHVVEVQEAFHRAASHGIVGEDLMLEHLHPNLEGYFVLADAFYEALREHEVLGPWEHPVSAEQARQEMPVTEVDRLYGEYRIAGLTAGWPFSERNERFRPPPPAGPVERIAQSFYRGRYPWPDAMRELLDHYRTQGETDEAARVAVLLAEAFPYRPQDQRTAAELLEKAGRPDAELYRRRAGE
jgi:lysophospholipase L1-like esterase